MFMEKLKAVHLLRPEHNLGEQKATVTYLGDVVGQGQAAPCQVKVKVIIDFAQPTAKPELLGCVGTSGFCPNIATYTEPLANLL